MKNIVFSFYINNRQEDYAFCMQFIEHFRDKHNVDLANDFCSNGRVRFWIGDSEAKYLVNKSNLFQSINTFSGVNETDLGSVTFILYVNCSDEDDMINFIYYCLLKEHYGEQCVLCIKPLEEKLKANIRDFFKNIFPVKADFCFMWSESQKSYKTLSTTDRIIRRYSPIFLIDEDEESVAYWRQSMHSFLVEFYRKNPIYKNVTYAKDYFLPHIYPSKITLNGKKQSITDGNDKDMHLIRTFVECFCDGDKSQSIDFVKERYELWKGEELFYLLKDIPLLAMYIFCILDYYAKDKESDSIEKIKNEIFNARDMADGLLQILENIYHSEKKRGYFCFRIHNNEKNRSGSYLRKHYKEYMDNLIKNRQNIENFLEFKIVDYSHNTIPKQFYCDFNRRRQDASEEDIQIYEKIREQVNNIKVRDFFQNDKLWESYNSISENVVNHYGLQIFDSLVTCYGGYFRVRSQENTSLNVDREAYCSLAEADVHTWKNGIPGTQYDVVIPFKEQKVLQNISVNVNINYTDYLLHKFEIFHGIDFTTEKCRNIYNSIPLYNEVGVKRSFQERKELTIWKLKRELIEKLEEKMPEGEFIMHFSADKIAITMIELFCKALMLYIAQKGKSDKCYVMVTNCTTSHFIEITRMFALFYDKQGHNSLMQDTQIFLSGKEEGEEFLISGANLGEVIGRTEKLAFARCVHPECLSILKNMLKNRTSKIMPNEMVNIVPFDMVDYNESGITLFERSLKSVLNKDVQSNEFGCKIENLHVKIGSKIHIRTFYEAELLFHNNYYTSRFAYWLFNNIRDNAEIQKSIPITLVGYENYSEMLLNELQTMLIEAKYQSEYIIYEQKALEKFRSGKSIEKYKDTQFIFIVPINSTTSTHVKLSGFLKKSIKNALKEKTDSMRYNEYEFRKTVNYGIILIGSKIKNEYWTKEKDHVIISSINKERINYYIEVESVWSHPLDCKDCFPEDKYINEVPLVETNKESVVPMNAIGFHEDNSHKKIWTFPKEEKKRIRQLSNFLLYHHIERNGNHYSYYFCTEKLWEFPDIRESVQKWLNKCRTKFSPENKKVYDIIVAPLHLSNAAFVEEVNHSLFSSAALVLHFDVNKEYRTNVRAKYSNVQQLYDNLSEDNEESIINFHYVDDTIISGQTFYRTKSLIMSLICQKLSSPVKINVFKSVVLLISRMSHSSIKNYIDQPDYFMSYFSLNISSMRVNEDACVLCKKRDEWNKLAEQASLNEVYSYWKKKCKKIECTPVERLWELTEEKDEQRQRRATRYMITSHKAKSLLESMYGSYSNKEIEKQIIDDLFPNPQRLNIEELIAVLKVLGRPFLSFRKEGREVSFHLMLKMLDALLNETNAPKAEDEKLDKILQMLWNNPRNRVIIIVILINRLVELESTFIIRRKSIERIMEFARHIKSADKQNEFRNNYLNRIKQLVGQSNDFTKCLYLEHLLLYGYEYDGTYKDAEFAAEPCLFDNVDFERKVYLENTKVLDYGIVMLADCVKNECGDVTDLLRHLKDNYYFDNFITYLSFYKVVETDECDQVKCFLSEAGEQMLQGMVQFEIFYEDMFGVKENELRFQKDTFVNMMKYLKKASGALDGEIIVPYESDDIDEEYVVLELAQNESLKHWRNNGRDLMDFMKEHDSFVANTYTIIEKEQQKWILIRFCNQNVENLDTIPMIYMLFAFEKKNERELLTALKNLLVFRNKIWRILNLSSNTLVQNWASGLFYKQQMLKSRATAHGKFDEWIQELKNVSKCILNKSEETDSIYKKYFELLVNTAIGHVNVQILGKAGVDMTNAPYNMEEYWNSEESILKAAEQVWSINLNIVDKAQLMQAGIRKCCIERKKAQYPDMQKLGLLILAVLQNAHKHNGYTTGIQKVSIYRKEDKLCIKNEVMKEKYEELRKAIQKDAYRKGEGISMAVIADLCKSWYTNVDYGNIFTVKEYKELCYFEVQLPILEEEAK